MDVTLIRLLDGTRLYLHAVIDNYSRRLLAWELANKLDPATTCRMLGTAGRHLDGIVPTVMADSGVESVNIVPSMAEHPTRSTSALRMTWRANSPNADVSRENSGWPATGR
jgi:transposase InsO family protein